MRATGPVACLVTAVNYGRFHRHSVGKLVGTGGNRAKSLTISRALGGESIELGSATTSTTTLTTDRRRDLPGCSMYGPRVPGCPIMRECPV
jgi:hypothetical protein